MTDEGPQPPPSADQPGDVDAYLRSLVDTVRRREQPADGMDRMDLLRERGYADRISQRRQYAKWALIGLGSQLGIADVVFVIYGFYRSWNVPTEVMTSWLGATVVEVIGVVLVITRHLFPEDSAD
jgi:hypothetical protein